jgi:argininosuccinate lyase
LTRGPGQPATDERQLTMATKVWGGRFREETEAVVHRFNASIGFDHRLYAYDIAGSIAHVRMLAKQGIITEDEASQIMASLAQIKRDLERGTLPLDDQYEDIHTLVERTLIDRIGAVGEKLHTGRSRNDQVALDVRLYVRETISRVLDLIRTLQVALIRCAEANPGVIMPGYTHLQRAQPVLLAHHLLAYYEMLKRDCARFEEGLGRVGVLPLGSAALAGSTFDLDREMVARELGFGHVSRNSMDAVSDRDFVLEFLFNGSVLMMHLSRLSEELILWSSQEFRFITIADGFCTGSSIMPQKKNPDIPELVRGKTGRVYGHLMSLLTTLKGLPLTYNKDLQEDKEGLFDAADTLMASLDVMGRLVGAISFDAKRLRQATEEGYLAATDLADYLVTKGMSFRQAHEVVGRIVLFAMDRQKELHQLTLGDLRDFSRQIEEDVFDWLDLAACVHRRNITGGTGDEEVAERLLQAKQELGL